MSAIFETEFRDLHDEEGNTTKASTAKLVLLALADHANDDGEGAYPGLTKMELKTALSRQTIINTYGALKYNGIIYLAGISKRNTNNYTINTRAFPKTNIDGQATLLVKPLDSTSQATLPELVKPLDPNHPLTIQEPSKEVVSELPKTDETKGDYTTHGTAYNRGEQERPDKVAEMLAMMNFPGAKKNARIEALQSAFGVAFVVNSESKEWREFAKYAIEKQDSDGWKPETFIAWVKQQKGYPDYWSCKRMRENYPKAFIQETQEEKVKLL